MHGRTGCAWNERKESRVLTVPTWVETDDPGDPCAYCVQWFTPEQFANLPITNKPNSELTDEDFGDDGLVWWDSPERMAPYMPDGPVSRLYRGVHDRCRQMLADYENQEMT